MRKILTPLFVRPVCLLLATSVFLMSFAPADTVVIPAGTGIQLETISELSSVNLEVGSIIPLRVIQDIKVEGKTVIAAGAQAKGQVVKVEGKKGLGKPGYVEIEIRTVTAVDGTEVRLSGGNFYGEGKDKQTTAIVLGVVLCILFLTMKGEEATIKPGKIISTTVAVSTEVNV
jgi:hypothetical protein